jgi:integrase
VFRKQGVWWVDYYVDGHRKRERIGLDKRLAETVLRKRKVEIAEGRFPEKRRPVTTTFNELAGAYFAYARDQQQKRSWARDRTSIRALTGYFGGKRLTEITPASIEEYRPWRRATISRRGTLVSPACINRELACLKRMLSVALKGLILLKGGSPRENPAAMVSLDREHNERDRVLNYEEFNRLMAAAPTHLRPIQLMAYQTGMRKGEISGLTWDRVDLKAGVIRLKDTDTKTGEGRIIPLTKELSEMLRNATIYLGVPYIFTYAGRRIGSMRRAFETACRQSGLTNVVFHDLCHAFVTNARRAGIDYFRIMAISGHKTMSVFKRYHTIDEGDLRQAMSQMDTYMDTSARDHASLPVQPVEKV